MSAVDAAIAEGYVDANNLFVTGGSGGGVLTAWIVGKTTRFKAAVTQKPVINWASTVLTTDVYTVHAEVLVRASCRGKTRRRTGSVRRCRWSAR